MSHPSPKRVLVVDDNIDAAQMVAELLILHGVNAICAVDGDEALRIAPGFVPHVVILDLLMPHKDGFAVLEEMQQLPELQRTVFVALSGWGGLHSSERLQRSGFTRHLAKPVSIESLLALVQ